MRAIVEATDLVHGAQIDDSAATLEPLKGVILKIPVPPGTQPGDVTYIVVKATVQAIIPT